MLDHIRNYISALLQSSLLKLNSGVLSELQKRARGGEKGLQLKKSSIFLVVEQNNLRIFIIAVLTVVGLVSRRSPPTALEKTTTQQIPGMGVCKSVNQ